MAPSDRRSGPVGHLADQRVDKSVDEQGNGNRQTDDVSPHPDHLIIIKQQKDGESVILDTVSGGTEAI